MPEAIASGPTEEDALREMCLALDVAVCGRIRDGMALEPPPAKASKAERHRVALPAPVAAKAAIYSRWRAAGISKSALAQRMGRSEAEVRRILDPDHGTKLDQLAEAAQALGAHLTLALEVA